MPRILYHWRKVAGSAAAGGRRQAGQALLAAKAALQEQAALLDGGATRGGWPGCRAFRLRRALDPPPPVTLVILTADPLKPLKGRGDVRLACPTCCPGLTQHTTYPDARILVVDDDGLCRGLRRCRGRGHAAQLSRFADPHARRPGVQLRAQGQLRHRPFVDTEYFVLLNDDLEGHLVRLARGAPGAARMDPRVAVAGARLLYPDGRVRRADIGIGVNGGAAHVFHGMAGDYVGHGASTHIIRNYSSRDRRGVSRAARSNL